GFPSPSNELRGQEWREVERCGGNGPERGSPAHRGRAEGLFLGEHQHSLDAKGRLIIPAKFRAGLGERFIVTRGLDRCLFAYSLTEWQAIEAKLKALPLTQSDARAFVRFFFSGATECEMDKQGRIMLPANLREYAQLERDVVVIGVSSRVEIWSKERWDNYSIQAEKDYANIAEKIVDFDLG